MRVKPLARENLSAQLYTQLRSALMDGQLSPGERITIASVAEQFGTSITPVREAIFRLVSERALEMRTATSIHVPKLDPRQLREVQLIRIHLEGESAARAAEVITPQQLAELAQIQHAFIEAARTDPAKASFLNRDFHFALLRIANLPILEGVVENMWVLMGPFLRLFHQRTPRRELSETEHRHHDLLVALEAQDPEAARRAIQDDIRWGEHLISQFEKGALGPP
ncbi:GntR family transcriptional regulator [Aquabacter sp. CN5-332]|uniref:GntR family transcriptional regulator n=1 Tax=Aquabacter sp. CN5-332 TaxID=3156608 RepID=UPI0032B446DF